MNSECENARYSIPMSYNSICGEPHTLGRSSGTQMALKFPIPEPLSQFIADTTYLITSYDMPQFSPGDRPRLSENYLTSHLRYPK